MQARGRRDLEEGIHARNRHRVEKSGIILGLLPSTNPKLDFAIFSREKVMLREREQAYFRAMLLREPGLRPRGVSRSPYQAQPATRGRRRRKGTPSASAPVPAPPVQLRRRPRTAEPTKSRPARACLPPPVQLKRRPRTAEPTKSRPARACLPPPVPLRRRPRTAEPTKSRAAQACYDLNRPSVVPAGPPVLSGIRFARPINSRKRPSAKNTQRPRRCCRGATAWGRCPGLPPVVPAPRTGRPGGLVVVRPEERRSERLQRGSSPGTRPPRPRSWRD